jgi:hypothetical protein
MPSGQSYQRPQAQNHTILNGQYGRYIIAQRLGSKNNVNFSRDQQEVFPPAGPGEDWNIGEGDILYMPKEAISRRPHGGGNLNNQGQQPWCLSSVNNYSVTKQQWATARGRTDQEKRRNIFMENNQVLGISFKSLKYEGFNRETLDDPVILVGGVWHTLNSGPYVFNPMDIACWDVPEHDKPMRPDSTQTTGTTPTVRKLIIVPLDKAVSLSVDTMRQWATSVHREHEPKLGGLGDEARAKTLGKHVYPIKSMSDEHDVFVAMCDVVAAGISDAGGIVDPDIVHGIAGNLLVKIVKSDQRTKVAVAKMIESVRRPERDARKRIIGRAIRGALPSERIDLSIF